MLHVDVFELTVTAEVPIDTEDSSADDTCIAAAAAGGPASLDLPQVGYYQLICSFYSLKCF